MSEKKPKFEVGEVWENIDHGTRSTWTILSIREVVNYPSGDHVHFGYVLELTIYFKSGDITKNRAYYSEKQLERLLEPEGNQKWYSVELQEENVR